MMYVMLNIRSRRRTAGVLPYTLQSRRHEPIKGGGLGKGHIGMDTGHGVHRVGTDTQNLIADVGGLHQCFFDT